MPFQNSLNALSFERILAIAEEVLPDSNPDIEIYHMLLEATERLMHPDRNTITLVAITHMAYGWMPTMLTLHFKELNDVDVWPFIDHGSFDPAFLSTLKGFTNNSIVGASKLLHFCQPEIYPIWDSRVYKRISGDDRRPDWIINKVSNYIAYASRVRTLVLNPQAAQQIEELRQILLDRRVILGYESPIRLVELTLWL